MSPAQSSTRDPFADPDGSPTLGTSAPQFVVSIEPAGALSCKVLSQDQSRSRPVTSVLGQAEVRGEVSRIAIGSVPAGNAEAVTLAAEPTGAPVVLTATFSCAEVTKEDVFKYLCTDGHNVLLTAFLVVGVECKLIVSEYVSSGDGRAVPLP